MNKILPVLTLAVAYIIKFCIYRYEVHLNALLNVGQLAGAYMIVVAVALAIASFVWIIRSQWVHTIVFILIDLWLIANIWYSKANFMLIDWGAILTIGQLRGFEDSILSYLDWNQLVIPLMSIGSYAILMGLETSRTDGPQWMDWTSWRRIFISAAVLWWIGTGCAALSTEDTQDDWQTAKERQIMNIHSPIAHFGIEIYHAIEDIHIRHNAEQPLTEEEESILSRLLTDSVAAEPIEGHLVYILVESWESWSLRAKDIHGDPVCRNIVNYVRTHPILFSEGILSQQQYGRSGDGQLITQTGLLPLLHGVACMRYGNNVYPNLAHFYNDGVVLDPYGTVWNQKVTSYSYGFKRHIYPDSRTSHSNDSIILAQAREQLEQASKPTCVLAITYNTHTPFHSVPATIDLSESYTSIENKYLQCVRYLDAQVGRFLAWADTATQMQNATIIITADHNHFPRKEGKGICPLIIRSPKIEKPVYIRQAFQMDIYPTVLSLIGQENYWWRGFGRNLLIEESQPICSPEESLRLSDKLIRRNYFKH